MLFVELSISGRGAGAVAMVTDDLRLLTLYILLSTQ